MGTTLFPKLEGKPKSHPLSSLFNYTRNSIACTLITGNKIIDFQMGVSMNLQVISKILSDNPGNQSYCHIPFFINMRHDKGNFILLSHRPAVIAGMCDGIDSDGESDKYCPFVDILHSSGILPLNLAFFHVFLAGVAFHALYICFDCDLIHAFSSHRQDTHQDMLAYMEAFPCVP